MDAVFVTNYNLTTIMVKTNPMSAAAHTGVFDEVSLSASLEIAAGNKLK